jgi:hypothetical protein
VGVRGHQHATEKRPRSRKDCPEHPAGSRAGERQTRPDTQNGKFSRALAKRQEETLRRRILRLIGRALEDVIRLEVWPHRVLGVRQPPHREGLAHQEIRELIVYARLGNAVDDPDRDVDRKADDGDSGDLCRPAREDIPQF